MSSQQNSEQPSSLLDLPDALLVAVLKCLSVSSEERSRTSKSLGTLHSFAHCECAQRTLLSAARAHSRLHQAAASALSSITLQLWKQRQMDSLLLYLGRHSQHIDSVYLMGFGSLALSQLPSDLHLTSLQLEGMLVQLLPDTSNVSSDSESDCPADEGELALPQTPANGILGAVGMTALKQLRLIECEPLDIEDDEEEEGVLGAALAQLPMLEELCLGHFVAGTIWRLPGHQLQQLQQLTSLQLDLACIDLLGPNPTGPALQPLTALTLLRALRVFRYTAYPDGVMHDLTAAMLSRTHDLTRLDVYLGDGDTFEPAALCGKQQLLHLDLGTAVPTAPLLSQLQSLTRLTYLNCSECLMGVNGAFPPPAAYSALTASSTLQHLDLDSCTLPEGVWQHVFPPGRQLPHLTCLRIAGIRPPSDDSFAAAPNSNLLVSCCPGLRSLDMRLLRCSGEALVPLQRLSRLQSLCWPGNLVDLQLLDLKHLTQLRCTGRRRGVGPPWPANITLESKAPDSEPVWRQLLRLRLDQGDPREAQQAAAALAE